MSKYVIALYIRLSVEDVKTDSLSIPNQLLMLGRHIDTIEQSDIEVLEFIDNGYSGVNFERPAVQELLDLVRQSKIDCIITKDFSRFGRNSIETSYFIEQVFPMFGTRFISVSDNFDSNDHKGDTGGIQVAFKFLMHEYHSQDLSRKTKSSKYAKFKRGEYQSSICLYGYKKGENGRLEIDEEVADIVRLIYKLTLDSKSAPQIAKVLCEQKVITPGEYRASKGKNFYNISRCRGLWQSSQITRIISDERYAGTYIIGKRAINEIGGRTSHLKDESEWVKIPNHHPAIISMDMYKEVQRNRVTFKLSERKPREYSLRAKVICGCCEHAMSRFGTIPKFHCRHTKIDESAECHDLKIKEQELESLLFDIISRQAQVVLNTTALTELEPIDFDKGKGIEYERQLEKCSTDKRRLYEKYVLGEIDTKEYSNLKSQIDIEHEHLDRVYTAWKKQLSFLEAEQAVTDMVHDIAKKVTLENKLTKVLVDLLIDKVLVYPDNRVDIDWKMSGFFDVLYT